MKRKNFKLITLGTLIVSVFTFIVIYLQGCSKDNSDAKNVQNPYSEMKVEQLYQTFSQDSIFVNYTRAAVGYAIKFRKAYYKLDKSKRAEFVNKLSEYASHNDTTAIKNLYKANGFTLQKESMKLKACKLLVNKNYLTINREKLTAAINFNNKRMILGSTIQKPTKVLKSDSEAGPLCYLGCEAAFTAETLLCGAAAVECPPCGYVCEALAAKELVKCTDDCSK